MDLNHKCQGPQHKSVGRLQLTGLVDKIETLAQNCQREKMGEMELLGFRGIRPRPMSLMAFLSVTLSLTSLMVPSSSTANEDDDRPSVTKVLEDYGFPPGLLPKGVIGYDLDKSTGKFAAYLNGTCSFSLEDSYDLKYKSAIKGYISKGRLRNLEGVSVKILLFWVNIVEVIRRGDDLELSVGIASASFPVDNFVERPQCGCGLNCNHVQVRKSMRNPFLNSS